MRPAAAQGVKARRAGCRRAGGFPEEGVVGQQHRHKKPRAPEGEGGLVCGGSPWTAQPQGDSGAQSGTGSASESIVRTSRASSSNRDTYVCVP